ncbi:hypothetical protein [Streptomyces sp. NPDC098781]|uniref:hypothetical protein n=1 Tax=Streptomyces sp. NPDC098781 TaxID=3366097 RepID=UPI00381EEA22
MKRVSFVRRFAGALGVLAAAALAFSGVSLTGGHTVSTAANGAVASPDDDRWG